MSEGQASLVQEAPCPSCGGSGRMPNPKGRRPNEVVCAACNGAGRIVLRDRGPR